MTDYKVLQTRQIARNAGLLFAQINPEPSLNDGMVRKAIKGLRKLPANVADQFRTAFQEIANSRGHWEVKKLAGREGYRLRIGGFRGIYKIEGEQVTVLVLDVGPRGGIYK